MLYSLVAYFVIRYHVPKMARAALLSCDHHGGKKAGIILWLPGETTSETTSFGLVFITNTAIFLQKSVADQSPIPSRPRVLFQTIAFCTGGPRVDLAGRYFSQPELLRLQSPTIRNRRAWNEFG